MICPFTDPEALAAITETVATIYDDRRQVLSSVVDDLHIEEVNDVQDATIRAYVCTVCDLERGSLCLPA